MIDAMSSIKEQFAALIMKERAEQKRAEAQRHNDTWSNALSGIGTDTYDKRLGTEFGNPLMVTSEVALQLWRGDDLAARVVETVPSEMLRQGFELLIKA